MLEPQRPGGGRPAPRAGQGGQALQQRQQRGLLGALFALWAGLVHWLTDGLLGAAEESISSLIREALALTQRTINGASAWTLSGERKRGGDFLLFGGECAAGNRRPVTLAAGPAAAPASVTCRFGDSATGSGRRGGPGACRRLATRGRLRRLAAQIDGVSDESD